MGGHQVLSNEPIVLARVEPFRLGEVEVIPATRQLVRGAMSETLEPRVMQVLVALADARGAVLTRDELIERCWGGRIVSENAINRVISRIRQIASAFGMDSFQLETITKVGYRIIVGGGQPPAAPTSAIERQATSTTGVDRRWAIGGLAASAIGGLGAYLWQRASPSPPAAAAALYQKGFSAREGGSQSHTEQAIIFFREATRIAPDYADAWGGLALAYGQAAGWMSRSDTGALAARSRSAAAQALRLDPSNPDARTAVILLRPYYRNWAVIEAGLRGVIRDHGEHKPSRFALGAILSEVGRWDESIEWLKPGRRSGHSSPTTRPILTGPFACGSRR